VHDERDHHVRLTKRLLAAAGVAGFGVAAIAGAGSAGAASVPVTFNVTGGSLTIGAQVLDFPAGASFSGTWDDETGALSGNLTVPPFSLTEPVPVTITVTQVGTATGNVNPATGQGTLSITLNIGLSSDLLPPGCGIDGIVINLSTSGVGGAPLNFDTGAMSMVGSGFNVPASAGCGDVGFLVNTLLGLPTTATGILLNLQQPSGPTDSSVPVDSSAPTNTDPGGTVPTDSTVPDFGAGGGTLPPTGASDANGTMALVALVIAALGGGLVAMTRRRTTA
jgi:hypothetical protein